MGLAPGVIEHDFRVDRDNALAGVDQPEVRRHLKAEPEHRMQEPLTADQPLLGVIAKQHAVDPVEEDVTA